MDAPTSWVYFLRSGDEGPIKIGFTGTTPNTRLAALQTGNPEPLRLIGAVPGTKTDESRLHTRFSAAWVQGEWFRPVPELLAFIEGALFARHAAPPSYDDICDPQTGTWEDIAEFCYVWQAVERVDELSVAAWCGESLNARLKPSEIAELEMRVDMLRGMSFRDGAVDRIGRDVVQKRIQDGVAILAAHEPVAASFEETFGTEEPS